MERHALTFAVRPGTERAARQVLAGYPRPDTEIDGGARLLGTSVFFWRHHVVRVMDVDGPLPLIMRHLSTQPAIRETETALNPLLAEPRDLGDQDAVRGFFARAMMTRVIHRVTEPRLLPASGDRIRIALRYPVRPGRAAEAAEVIKGARSLLGAETTTVLASTTVFRHGDLLVRVADFVGDLDQAAEHLGRTVIGRPATSALTPLLEPGWDLTTEDGFGRFFAEQRLALVTHRQAETVTR